MSAESDFNKFWTEFLTSKDWLREKGNNEALRQLASATASSFKVIASQLDLLLSELNTRGVFDD
jgi:hypothetical protein